MNLVFIPDQLKLAKFGILECPPKFCSTFGGHSNMIMSLKLILLPAVHALGTDKYHGIGLNLPVPELQR